MREMHLSFLSKNNTTPKKSQGKPTLRHTTLAYYNLANAYYYGHGCTQDYPESVKWHTLAANRGSVPSQHDLGIAYVSILRMLHMNRRILPYESYCMRCTAAEASLSPTDHRKGEREHAHTHAQARAHAHTHVRARIDRTTPSSIHHHRAFRAGILCRWSCYVCADVQDCYWWHTFPQVRPWARCGTGPRRGGHVVDQSC